MGKSDKVRLTIDLSEKLHNKLGKLGELVDAESKAHVMREALKMYEYLATEVVTKGSEIGIREKNAKEFRALPLFITVDGSED